MLGDLGVRHLAPVRLQGRQRTGLVEPHEPGIADYVGSEDCGQSSLHGYSTSASTLCQRGWLRSGSKSESCRTQAFVS